MDKNIELSIAIETIDRKIADLNLKIIENRNKDLEDELDKYLNIRKKIYEGNVVLIQKVINNEI